MALGRKTGGRRVGALNKRTLEITERLAALDCDPLAGMAKIAMDPESPPELRGRMYAELAQYVYPKRRAIDPRDTGNVVAISINFGKPERTIVQERIGTESEFAPRLV
ncbi:MAG: hypothetical protein ACKVQA_03295 [Burkholderiales bacterium]